MHNFCRNRPMQFVYHFGKLLNFWLNRRHPKSPTCKWNPLINTSLHAGFVFTILETEIGISFFNSELQTLHNKITYCFNLFNKKLILNPKNKNNLYINIKIILLGKPLHSLHSLILTIFDYKNRTSLTLLKGRQVYVWKWRHGW